MEKEKAKEKDNQVVITSDDESQDPLDQSESYQGSKFQSSSSQFQNQQNASGDQLLASSNSQFEEIKNPQDFQQIQSVKSSPNQNIIQQQKPMPVQKPVPDIQMQILQNAPLKDLVQPFFNPDSLSMHADDFDLKSSIKVNFNHFNIQLQQNIYHLNKALNVMNQLIRKNFNKSTCKTLQFHPILADNDFLSFMFELKESFKELKKVYISFVNDPFFVQPNPNQNTILKISMQHVFRNFHNFKEMLNDFIGSGQLNIGKEMLHPFFKYINMNNKELADLDTFFKRASIYLIENTESFLNASEITMSDKQNITLVKIFSLFSDQESNDQVHVLLTKSQSNYELLGQHNFGFFIKLQKVEEMEKNIQRELFKKPLQQQQKIIIPNNNEGKK